MISLIDSHIWTQWDQSHYLDIAASGYRAFLCPPHSGFHHGDWCGNASWFPLYPILIALTVQITSHEVSPILIGLFLSNFFFLLLLLFVMPLLANDINCDSKASSIAYRSLFLIFFPSSIYFHAVFPISLATFTAGLSLHLIFNKKLIQALPFILLSGIAYPPMLVLSLPLTLLTLYLLKNETAYSLRKSIVLPLSLCAIMPLIAYQIAKASIAWSSHVPHSFDLVGEKYGHGIHNPLYALKSVLIRASHLNEYSSLQTLFLIFCLVCVAVSIAVYIRCISYKKPSLGISPSIQSLVLLCYASLFLILPMVVGGAVSTYRTESLSAIPITILVDRFIKSSILRLIILVISIALSIASLMQFLDGKLI